MNSYDAEEGQGKKKAPPAIVLVVPFIPVVVALIEHGPEWIEVSQVLFRLSRWENLVHAEEV